MSNLLFHGSRKAPVVVVCDPPSPEVYNRGMVMPQKAKGMFLKAAEQAGLYEEDFCFVTAAPPIPEISKSSEKRLGEFIAVYREELLEQVKRCKKAELIIYMGKTAGRQVAGRAIKINQARGKFVKLPEYDPMVLPLLSTANVLARPELKDIFFSDFKQVGKFFDGELEQDTGAKVKYEWCTDLSFLLKKLPKVITCDTETDGLRWAEGNVPLVASICYAPGKAICIPLDTAYYPALTEAKRTTLIGQLRELLGNRKVRVIGHNFKFDIHMLRSIGVRVANWWLDTIQMAFAVDDNMQIKNLAECVRRWVSTMAGYSDEFEQKYDYAKMREVPHEDMLQYACADVDATFRLAKVLLPLLKADERQYNAFRRVQMPALRTFANTMERFGMEIDTEALAALEKEAGVLEEELYRKLIRKVPGAVKRKHAEKGLFFSRDDFTRDVLFSEDGFGLTPRVFTKSTKALGKRDRVPSISSKDHLPYFTDKPFVVDLIEYSKLQKMRTTYIGASSKEEFSEVKELKDGQLPKRVREAFAEVGAELRRGELRSLSDVRVRRRRRCIDMGGKTLEAVKKVPTKDGAYIVTKDGAVYKKTYSPPTGFWKYLQNENTIHQSILLDRTVTGRTASRDPNTQNIPKRSKLAKVFGRVFKARKGFVYVMCDLSQAELRIAAWMADEKVMLKIYRDGGDIHTHTAAALIGIPVERFKKMDGSKKPVPDSLKVGGFDGTTYGDYFDFKRFQAKAVNFGFLYGMGWRKFIEYAKTSYGLDLTEEQAQEFRNKFFDLYPGLIGWHKSMRGRVNESGYVRALHGALRRLPSIDSDDEMIRGECERQAINSPVQRFASDLALIGMVEFDRNCPLEDCHLVNFVHDAVVVEVREEMAEEAAAGLKWCMENPPLEEWFGIKSPIPLIADCSRGPNLTDQEKYKVEAAEPSWLAAA